YYQVYDLTSSELVDQSRVLQLLDLQFSANELRQIMEGPMIMDIDTDQGQLRFYNDRITSPLGKPYLLQTAISFESRQLALDRFVRLSFALVPLGALLAAASGWFMSGRALKPVQDITRAAQQIDVSQLDQRLPLQGSGDEIDELARTFN